MSDTTCKYGALHIAGDCSGCMLSTVQLVAPELHVVPNAPTSRWGFLRIGSGAADQTTSALVGFQIENRFARCWTTPRLLTDAVKKGSDEKPLHNNRIVTSGWRIVLLFRLRS